MKQGTLPDFAKPFLWSYDVAALDLERDKKRIITNVLNWGTKQATDWLRAEYSPEDIREVLVSPLRGEWHEKSYHYWSLIYGTSGILAPRKII
jgi:hypothetical protein